MDGLGSNNASITIVESDLIDHIKSLAGEAVDGVASSVTGPDAGSSASPSASASATSGASTSFATYKSTTIISVTSCSENESSETGVSATQGPTTVTSSGETTVLTTWITLTEAPTSSYESIPAFTAFCFFDCKIKSSRDPSKNLFLVNNTVPSILEKKSIPRKT
ncbi:hypothetical protein OXX80_009285 [Metschnikowia pulcherrima]